MTSLDWVSYRYQHIMRNRRRIFGFGPAMYKPPTRAQIMNNEEFSCSPRTILYYISTRDLQQGTIASLLDLLLAARSPLSSERIRGILTLRI
jgi:hypothetical protein